LIERLLNAQKNKDKVKKEKVGCNDPYPWGSGRKMLWLMITCQKIAILAPLEAISF